MYHRVPKGLPADTPLEAIPELRWTCATGKTLGMACGFKTWMGTHVGQEDRGIVSEPNSLDGLW